MHEAEASRPVGQPAPGYFRVRLVRKGPWVGARIVRHSDGSWQAMVDGQRYAAALDPASAPWVFRIWHSGRSISEHEYLSYLRTKGWAMAHSPDHPAAHPREPVDLTKTPPLF